MADSSSFQLVQHHSSDNNDLSPNDKVNSSYVVDLDIRNASNSDTGDESELMSTRSLAELQADNAQRVEAVRTHPMRTRLQNNILGLKRCLLPSEILCHLKLSRPMQH